MLDKRLTFTDFATEICSSSERRSFPEEGYNCQRNQEVVVRRKLSQAIPNGIAIVAIVRIVGVPNSLAIGLPHLCGASPNHLRRPR